MEGLLKKIFLFVFIVGFVGSVNPVGIDAASYKECSWGDTGAVSYTHLDVYKRQEV